MGFINVVYENELDLEALLKMWPDVIWSPEQEKLVNVTNYHLKNASRLIVEPLQIVVQVMNKKVVDIITQPGAYIYHSDIAKVPNANSTINVFQEFVNKRGDISLNTELVFIQLEKVCDSDIEMREILIPSQKFENGSWSCSCGKENNSNFCNYCGKPRPIQNISRPLRCYKCGVDLSGCDNPVFCPMCGTKLM